MTQAIALFIPSLNGGGAERVMVSLANGLAARGLPVDLVLRTNEGIYRSQVDARVNVIVLSARRTLGTVFALARYLRTRHPRVMLSAMNYVNVVAVWARALSGASTRLVLSDHANLSQAMADAGGPVARVLPGIMRLSYPRADAVVAVSNGVADDLARRIGYPRDRIATCHNPIETVALVKQSGEPLSHPWFTPGGPPLIVGAGRLSPEKDFGTLIQAFNLVREGRPARLAILGEGTERPALEALVQSSPYRDDILLAGFQANPYNWMRAASVFVLSSRWEGFGNVLVEAMACGTPVISTACPSGPEEILGHGKWGRLVPVGDAPALADAVRDTLGATRADFDVQRRAQDFSVDKAVDAYLAVLDPQHSVNPRTQRM
ncbi:glycosyltransferase [Pusillimonas sp. TS35]|nr:glycosyltransferase [Pusillimonas sp. TS35]